MLDDPAQMEVIMSRIMACATTLLCASASLLGAQQQPSGPKAPAETVVYMSSAKASYARVTDTPITHAPLFGDSNVDAPHGEFITFPPNFDAGGWHVHTNTVNLVVLKGAYIYRDENGEKRVGPGEFIRIPAGHRHWSGSDAKEGAVFYAHQQGKMDQKSVQ
jgi:mannose-6-phosphate isomerase-like protein (cupin superfamily)